MNYKPHSKNWFVIIVSTFLAAFVLSLIATGFVVAIVWTVHEMNIEVLKRCLLLGSFFGTWIAVVVAYEADFKRK